MGYIFKHLRVDPRVLLKQDQVMLGTAIMLSFPPLVTHPVALRVHVPELPRAQHAQIDGDNDVSEGASLIRPDVDAFDGERPGSPLGKWGLVNRPEVMISERA